MPKPAPAPQRPIPNRLFFKIGEVCELVGVEPYVLRFWETEFPNLAPQKSRSGHRVYRRKDVETIVKIKELLYEKGFTIPGARKQLSRSRAVEPLERERILKQMRQELGEILTLLRRST
jgi:DNA-binding transcriptional MerR regulator